MSVYKKLHKVQSATRSLAANTEGQTGAARYNYVSGAKLLGVIRPMMDKEGLILTQEVIGIDNQPITYMTRNGEKTEMFTSLHIRFTWIDADDGSSIANEFYANGMNAWDKGLGSALTYAERYYLMKTFHIATDEDDIDALVKDEAIKPAAQAAPAAPKAASTPFKQSDPETYWKIVDKYAKGIATKTGGDYRSTFIKMYKPDDAYLWEFDHDVDMVRTANNL